MHQALTNQVDSAQGQLATAQISRWQLSVSPSRRLYLPTFAGSTLRGAFGHALRQLACHCHDSQHHTHDCLYARIFEGHRPNGDNPHSAPPGFVISPPDRTGSVSPNQVFAFSVTLVTQHEKEIEVCLEAWAFAMQRGIGQHKVPCRITDVQPFDTGWQVLSQSLQIELTSPWQIKRNNRPLKAKECELPDLLIALAQRQRHLDHHYQLGLSPPDNAALIRLADEIDAKFNLKDVRWQRASARQGTKHPLCGLQGNVNLHHSSANGLAPLTRLLNLGCWLHAGGKTALGQGGIRLHPKASVTTLHSFPGIQLKER